MTSINQRIYYNTSQGPQYKEFEKNTEYISLSGIEITSIEFAHFGNFPFLRTIRLSSTSITYLSTYGIGCCERLENLSITFSEINDANLNSLEDCSRLESLDLTDNKLTKIDFLKLSEHPSLKSIRLVQNLLTEIDLESLGSIPNLTTIELQDNQLVSIDLTSLSQLENLMHLNLGNNPLRSIVLTPLTNVKTLRTINCSSNKLDHIDLSPLSGIESLEKIVLSGNAIRKMDLSPLAGCRLLKEVDLRGNQIQELDIGPLLHCPNLQQLHVNEDVMLWIPQKFKPSRRLPNWMQLLVQGVKLLDMSVEYSYEKQIIRRKEQFSYINPQSFNGFMLDLVKEINDAFIAGCYICTAFLSRKLLENLVISIMQKIFGTSHPDYFLSKDRSRTKNFGIILKKFWEVFPVHIKQFSPAFKNLRIDKIEKDLEELKNEFNVDVHEIGSFTDEGKLQKVRKTLLDLIKFLKHIDEKII